MLFRSHINREKIDAIREAVKELEKAGYIVRSRERDEKGRLRGADYVIYEQPQPKEPEAATSSEQPPTSPLRPLPLLRFAASATGGAHLCSIQYYLRFWLSICRTSLAVSALRIMRYCLKAFFFVFWFPIFVAFRNGQDRSLQNVLGRIANLQNIRRAPRPQARFG